MNVSFEDYEAYLLCTYGNSVTEQGLFMKLVEEIGEVAEVLNMRAGRKKVNEEDMQTQLANELADVIHYVVGIAAINDIDLSGTIIDKDKKAAGKYHHNTCLESFLMSRKE